VSAVAQLLIVGGKGGVGKTTIAAATAIAAAERGRRCVVASIDRAHSLGDVLGQPLGPEPMRVEGAENLWALELDPQAELRREWGALQSYIGRLLAYLGAAAAVADEMAILPGLEELLVLARLSELVSAEEFDLCVADFAPTASSLRYLSFPGLVGGTLGKWIEWDHRLARLLRPLEGRYMRVPVPEERVYDAIGRLANRIALLEALLADAARTGVRLVMVPESVVLAETRRAITYLSLFGLSTDVVIANRVFPAGADLGYLSTWSAIQQRLMEQARADFSGVPLLTLPWQSSEIVGLDALRGLAVELYGAEDPGRLRRGEPPIVFETEGNNLVLSVALPHAAQAQMDLRQRDSELVLTVGGWRRTIALPDSFAGRRVTKATWRQDRLRVLFGPGRSNSREGSN
jgi:arsenite-transporting ATPase